MNFQKKDFSPLRVIEKSNLNLDSQVNSFSEIWKYHSQSLLHLNFSPELSFLFWTKISLTDLIHDLDYQWTHSGRSLSEMVLFQCLPFRRTKCRKKFCTKGNNNCFNFTKIEHFTFNKPLSILYTLAILTFYFATIYHHN